jgi:translation elongation factor EF-Tu-like GTPase
VTVCGLAVSNTYAANWFGGIRAIEGILRWLSNGAPGWMWIAAIAAVLIAILALVNAVARLRQRRKVRQAVEEAGGPDLANVISVTSVSFHADRGVLAKGRMESGRLRVGDEVQIIGGHRAKVDRIDRRIGLFRRDATSEATFGDKITLTFSDLREEHLDAGDVITSATRR